MTVEANNQKSEDDIKMNTPKSYTTNLKNKVITRDMLELALFSVNKRAKNCRDKSRAYRHDIHNTSLTYKQKMNEYYAFKDLFLTLVEPDCIHEEHFIRFDEECVNYYLFYRFDKCSFHHPIDKKDCEKYKNLPIIKISGLSTHGKPVDTLLSVQFVRKMVDLINSGDYTYIKCDQKSVA